MIAAKIDQKTVHPILLSCQICDNWAVLYWGKITDDLARKACNGCGKKYP